MPTFSSVGNILLLAFGFGFVIFWHEMGHFLAAKWADVKVEQFAVGFGQAMLSWRKGLGFRWGSSQDEYQDRLKKQIEQSQGNQLQVTEQTFAPTEAQLSAAGNELGISETEYRLNWIPLGGYVKMLGQDDMKPGQVVSDPRSYNNKSISQRMVIVSAGVIMNVILAAFGFMYIFTVGFKVPKPLVGMVIPGSPAQQAYRIDKEGKHVPAPIQVGDTILELNGRWQSDFEKIHLNTALLISGDPVPVTVQHINGTTEQLYVVPNKPDADTQFPLIGIGPSQTLAAVPVDPDLPKNAKAADDGDVLPELNKIQPGDIITQIDGKPIETVKIPVALYDAVQAAAGKPVAVTIKNAAGISRSEKLASEFVPPFDEQPISFGGLRMLAEVATVPKESPAFSKLHAGDIVMSIADAGSSGDQEKYPTQKSLMDFIRAAGANKTRLTMTVRRDGKTVTVIGLVPSYKISKDHLGLDVSLTAADQQPIVAEIPADSAAKTAGIPAGARLVSIDGKPISNWFDVNDVFNDLKPETAVAVVASVDDQDKTFSLKPTDADIEKAKQNQLLAMASVMLQPADYERKASNPLEAAKWGIGETRDAILQVYQTVRSMIKGSISSTEISGPVGILGAGYRVAELGTTRLVWFLSIISANLAVMNFLPIPIVDGGLFTFLIIEKIKGSPISPRVQAAAQAAGLVILLSVFAFATYQDVVNRLPFLLR
jgi:regulator of sigma E protease